MSELVHLAQRFVGSLRPGGPSAADEAWVASILGPGEHRLWTSMSGPDRRHAVGVARAVPERLAAPALLHDVGKIASGLGTFGRVPATLLGLAGIRPQQGRFGRYLHHDEIGAALLRAAGAHDVTVRWAREHHLPRDHWTIDHSDGDLLKAADND